MGRISATKPSSKAIAALLVASRQLLADGESRDEVISQLGVLAHEFLRTSATPLELNLCLPSEPTPLEEWAERVGASPLNPWNQKVDEALGVVLRQLLADGFEPDELIAPMLYIVRGQLRVGGARVEFCLKVPD
jgi:hypothetical protein